MIQLPTPKFIGYTRVSGRSQVDGDGPERQETSIRTFANVNRLHVAEIVHEPAISGTVECMDRPAFAKMVEDIETLRASGTWVDGIIVERMDRLARDLMVSEMLLKECRQRRIQVLCADQGTDNVAEVDQDPTRTLIRQVLGALAQWEKSALVMKLKKARDRKKVKDGRCEGQKPMGTYPHELAVISYLRDAVTTGGYSYRRMVRELNESGFRNRKGGLWTLDSVESLVRKFTDQKGNPSMMTPPRNAL